MKYPKQAVLNRLKAVRADYAGMDEKQFLKDLDDYNDKMQSMRDKFPALREHAMGVIKGITENDTLLVGKSVRAMSNIGHWGWTTKRPRRDDYTMSAAKVEAIDSMVAMIEASPDEEMSSTEIKNLGLDKWIRV